MSRTYRRKGQPKRRGWFDDLDWYVSEWVRGEEGYKYLYRKPYPKDSPEYKKGKARYHSDAASHNCKEPGPSWWRNMTNTRPLRQQGRREIHKWLRNPDYEPLIDAMGYLEYWT